MCDKFDFPDATAPELHVPLQFTRPDHFVLNPVLHRRDLAQYAAGDGARVTERLDHLDKFSGQRSIACHDAGLD